MTSTGASRVSWAQQSIVTLTDPCRPHSTTEPQGLRTGACAGWGLHCSFTGPVRAASQKLFVFSALPSDSLRARMRDCCHPGSKPTIHRNQYILLHCRKRSFRFFQGACIPTQGNPAPWTLPFVQASQSRGIGPMQGCLETQLTSSFSQVTRETLSES